MSKHYSMFGNGAEMRQHLAQGNRLFQGERMRCVVCGAEQLSDPNVESGWTAIQVDGNQRYVCPGHFPPEAAGVEAMSEAWRAVLLKVLSK